MGLRRFILVTIAISMAITIATISITSFSQVQNVKEENLSSTHEEMIKPMPFKRMSRFLTENNKNVPKPADHCHKDNELCHMTKGYNSTCCNNKCMDLSEDKHNCGACHNKCKYTDVCCRGKCVNVNFDKRHCGGCNNKCRTGEFCVYGITSRNSLIGND